MSTLPGDTPAVFQSRAGKGFNEQALLAAFATEGACQFLAVGQRCTKLEMLQARWRTLPIMDALSDAGFVEG